jgi:Family of unknown function (DUF5683)
LIEIKTYPSKQLRNIPLRISLGGVLFICTLFCLTPFLSSAQDTIPSAKKDTVAILLPDSGSVQHLDTVLTIVRDDSTLSSPNTAQVISSDSASRDTSGRKIHSVRKATLLSTFLPGAGQIYNKRIWKVPIIYGAFGGLIYLVQFNNNRFKEFENALLSRYDNDPTTIDKYQDIYTEDNLKSLSEYYRRNRDLSVIGISLVYVLNIIDAHVDAHLFSFNVDDNLSINWSPVIQPTPDITTTGLAFTLRF